LCNYIILKEDVIVPQKQTLITNLPSHSEHSAEEINFIIQLRFPIKKAPYSKKEQGASQQKIN
jgi:hypothetical protein